MLYSSQIAITPAEIALVPAVSQTRGRQPVHRESVSQCAPERQSFTALGIYSYAIRYAKSNTQTAQRTLKEDVLSIAPAKLQGGKKAMRLLHSRAELLKAFYTAK